MIKRWSEYLKEAENSPFNLKLIEDKLEELKRLFNKKNDSEFKHKISCEGSSCSLNVSIDINDDVYIYDINFSKLKVSKNKDGKKEEKVLKSTPLLIGVSKCLEWLDREIKSLI